MEIQSYKHMYMKTSGRSQIEFHQAFLNMTSKFSLYKQTLHSVNVRVCRQGRAIFYWKSPGFRL